MLRGKKAGAFFLSLFSLILFTFLAACGSQSVPNNSASTNSEEGTKSDFPEKSIEMIVPYAAGGSTDQIARLLQKAMEEYLPNGQSLQVVNTPGGAGTIGLTKVLNAEPDGYTIGLTASGALTNQPHYGNTSYTHDSFQPIVRIASSPILLAVKNDAPWESLDEWLDYIQQNPGDFTYSSSGTGNPAHIAMEKLGKELNTQTVNVPAEGSGEAFTAMLGGHVKGTSGSSQQFAGQIESGDIRILANMGSIKREGYENVPTLTEQGIDAETDIFFGILAPKGIPEEQLNILHDAFKQALEDNDLVNQFRATGIEANYAGPEEFQNVITESFNSEGEILKDIGLVE